MALTCLLVSGIANQSICSSKLAPSDSHPFKTIFIRACLQLESLYEAGKMAALFISAALLALILTHGIGNHRSLQALLKFYPHYSRLGSCSLVEVSILCVVLSTHKNISPAVVLDEGCCCGQILMLYIPKTGF